MLKKAPILIVENEPFIALFLATAVTEAEGKVVGPAEMEIVRAASSTAPIVV